MCGTAIGQTDKDQAEPVIHKWTRHRGLVRAMKQTHSDECLGASKMYRIDVQGRLDESWSDWIDGMAIDYKKQSDGSDVTIIMGPVVDQAALHGIFNRIRDLNLPVLSVRLIAYEPTK